MSIVLSLDISMFWCFGLVSVLVRCIILSYSGSLILNLRGPSNLRLVIVLSVGKVLGLVHRRFRLKSPLVIGFGVLFGKFIFSFFCKVNCIIHCPDSIHSQFISNRILKSTHEPRHLLYFSLSQIQPSSKPIELINIPSYIFIPLVAIHVLLIKNVFIVRWEVHPSE